jgi:hypothetical protein
MLGRYPAVQKRYNREIPWQIPLGSSPTSRSEVVSGTDNHARLATDSLSESRRFMDAQVGASR